jgi:hypothetical protein
MALSQATNSQKQKQTVSFSFISFLLLNWCFLVVVVVAGGAAANVV